MVGLPQLASAETVLRIGMTAADIPRTLGQPDQGFEGNRFTGLTMYDALTMWDLSSADKASVVIPGLATEWKVDEADKKKWTFKLRPGVTFHDGSPFNADAVVWNVEKVLKQDAPQFDASQVGVTASRMPTLASARKIDDMTVELTTKEPDSFLPINLTNLFMASPSKWQKRFTTRLKAPMPRRSRRPPGRRSRKDASGTGPWKMSKFTPRERLELVKNDGYWDKARVPKVDRMVLLPMPEANARTAALLSGQVDWVEAPAPDAVKEIKQRGFQLQAERIAACLAVAVLAHRRLAVERHPRPQGGQSLHRSRRPQGRPARRPDGAGDRHLRARPSLARQADLPDQVRQGRAQKLMQEAGFGPSKKLTVKTQTSASGSGQMQPLPMNEYLQQALAECYFDVQLDVIEWNTLFTNWRRGAKDPTANGANATNVTYAAMDPVLRAGALPAVVDGAAGLEQLGLHQQPQVRRTGDQGAPDLRSRRA